MANQPTLLAGIFHFDINQGSRQVIAAKVIAWDPDTDERAAYDTSSLKARFTVRKRFGSTILLFCSSDNGSMSTGPNPPKRIANTAYALNDRVVPSTLNGRIYRVTTAGTSHASVPPTWSTIIGATVTDGTVVYTVEADDRLTNVRLYLTPGLTVGLTDWGVGRYDIELYDPNDANQAFRILEGNIRLKREVTTV